MYGNNIGSPFMMANNISYGPMMRGIPMMGGTMMNGPAMMGTRIGSGGLGSLFGLGRGMRGAEGLLSSVRSFNLGGLLNGASKALGVVNQAIPIVKEIGPMMNNMKSMLKIASIFKDETDNNTKTTISSRNIDNETIKEDSNIKENSTKVNSTTTNKSIVNNEPNFFL